MIAHCEAVAEEMPVIGFYLQPAVGGIELPRSFWRRLAGIDNVIGVKVAPFNRYATLDVVHGVAEAGAAERISLYTGNDDHIVLDLTVPFRTEAGRAALRRRPARPLVGVGADCGRDPRALPRGARCSPPCRPTCSRSTAQ